MTQATHTRLYWNPDIGLRPGDTPRTGLLAADSWLVTDGAARAVERHRDRFARACVAAGVSRLTTECFWEEALAAIPPHGDWFPRAELRTDGRLAFLLRAAPPRGTGLRVLVWPGPDPRTRPRVKGPDLERLAGVRQGAVRAGADEALLCTGSDLLVESTTSALLWWEGDTLCLPSQRLRVLPSVTAALLVERARELGIRVRQRHARPQTLDERETWLVNALHGIRTVTEWTGSSLRPGAAERAPAWRAHLESLRLPLTGRSGPHAPR
ncbi:aminotransferase class IV [Nocardiopsis lucentensis]|uniref:aminotransferase class IV n=1 Tax=Nocardiopsis lucentensis TaxID=53441 RepID=UPI00034DB1A0|nr:aminotransferase class IV [Nocardiopsis lucentensis]